MDDPAKLFVGFSLFLTLYKFLKPKTIQRVKESINENNYRSVPSEFFSLSNLKKQLESVTFSPSPQLCECKRAEFLIFCYAMQYLALKNRQLKEKRNKKRRRSAAEMEQYLKLLIQGLSMAKQVGKQIKKKIQEILKVDFELFKAYKSQLDELRKQLHENIYFFSSPSKMQMQKIRQVLEAQINYLKEQSDDLALRVAEGVKLWTNQQKQQIPKILPLLIIDQSLQKQFPLLDEAQIELAKSIHSQQLKSLIEQFKAQEFKLLVKINQKNKTLL